MGMARHVRRGWMKEAQVGRTVVRREYIMLLRLGEDPNAEMGGR